jgi:hypothetical protein
MQKVLIGVSNLGIADSGFVSSLDSTMFLSVDVFAENCDAAR